MAKRIIDLSKYDTSNPAPDLSDFQFEIDKVGLAESLSVKYEQVRGAILAYFLSSSTWTNLVSTLNGKAAETDELDISDQATETRILSETQQEVNREFVQSLNKNDAQIETTKGGILHNSSAGIRLDNEYEDNTQITTTEETWLFHINTESKNTGIIDASEVPATITLKQVGSVVAYQTEITVVPSTSGSKSITLRTRKTSDDTILTNRTLLFDAVAGIPSTIVGYLLTYENTDVDNEFYITMQSSETLIIDSIDVMATVDVSSSLNMQGVYENSTEPEIETDSTHRAVVYKDGTGGAYSVVSVIDGDENNIIDASEGSVEVGKEMIARRKTTSRDIHSDNGMVSNKFADTKWLGSNAIIGFDGEVLAHNPDTELTVQTQNNATPVSLTVQNTYYAINNITLGADGDRGIFNTSFTITNTSNSRVNIILRYQREGSDEYVSEPISIEANETTDLSIGSLILGGGDLATNDIFTVYLRADVAAAITVSSISTRYAAVNDDVYRVNFLGTPSSPPQNGDAYFDVSVGKIRLWIYSSTLGGWRYTNVDRT